jgi:hypothetical protein
VSNSHTFKSSAPAAKPEQIPEPDLVEQPAVLVWTVLITTLVASLSVVFNTLALLMAMSDSSRTLLELADSASLTDYSALLLSVAMGIGALAMASALYRRHRWAWYALLLFTLADVAYLLWPMDGVDLFELMNLAFDLLLLILLLRREMRRAIFRPHSL